MQKKPQAHRDRCSVCKPLTLSLMSPLLSLGHITYIYGITNMQIILKLYLVMYLIFLLVALIGISELIDLKSLTSPIVINHYLLSCYCQKTSGSSLISFSIRYFHLPQWDLLSILLLALCNRLLACKD